MYQEIAVSIMRELIQKSMGNIRFATMELFCGQCCWQIFGPQRV